jgi:hypothetical protein
MSTGYQGEWPSDARRQSVPPAPYAAADQPPTYHQTPYGPGYPGGEQRTPPPKKKSRKKLWITLGILAVLIAGCGAAVIGAVGKAANDVEQSVQDTTPGDGAMADVTLTKFTRDEHGYGVATLTIKNSTDTVQNYLVTVAVENKAGDQLSTLNGAVESLAPGQTTVTKAQGLDEVPAGATAKVVEVTRVGS